MIVVIAILIAIWLTAGRDPLSGAISRGGAGMARVGWRAGKAHWRAERARSKAARLRKRHDRWRRWRKSGRLGSAAVGLENGLRSAGHAAAEVGRAARAGIKEAPAGYRPAVEQAKAKREARREKARERRAERARRLGITEDSDTTETPAPAGDTTPTEGNPMVTHPGSNIDPAAVRLTELQTVDDLRAETTSAHDVADAIREHVAGLAKWLDELPERYLAADWKTREVSTAITGLDASTVSVPAVDGLVEGLDALLRALDSTQSLTEQVNEQGAEGRTEAFAAQ